MVGNQEKAGGGAGERYDAGDFKTPFLFFQNDGGDIDERVVPQDAQAGQGDYCPRIQEKRRERHYAPGNEFPAVRRAEFRVKLTEKSRQLPVN